MAATFYEGGRRSGKSKYAVYKIEQYLKEGRRVATNLDLFLENLCPDSPKTTYTRIPDFPRSTDLFALGNAYPSLNPDDPDTYDEDKNGLVVLDELLTSFNSRNWADKDRLKVINWIVLSGKAGWDLIFIGQSFDAVDAQIRDTVIDRIVSFRSSENLSKGFFMNKFVQPIMRKFYGKRHFASFYEGKTKAKENYSYFEAFKHDHVHSCYKTGQIFKKDVTYDGEGKKMVEVDHRASYTVIGSHYFDKQSLSLVHVPKSGSNKKRKFSIPKFKFEYNPKYLNALFLTTTLSFAFLYINKEQSIMLINSKAPETQQKLELYKQKQKPDIDYDAQRTDLESSDLSAIYVTCSVYSDSGSFDYCFANEKGLTVRPHYIGYKVLYVNECHAKLIRGSVTLDVYCNPVIEQSDYVEPEYYEQELASN